MAASPLAFPSAPPVAPDPTIRTRAPGPRPAPSPPRAPDALAHVRESTRAQHEALERALDLMDPGLTLDRYRHWLVVLRGFHAPLERRLAAIDARTPIGLDVGARARAAWLDADLAALGATVGDGIPDCRDLPAIDGVTGALGALYVLDGSTLGARVICRHLDATLGLHADDGARFFAGHGARTGPMWSETRRALQRHVDAGGDLDALTAGAAGTFAALCRHVRAMEP